MVELIAKISKGTNMDQIYIPKQRVGMALGDFVIISPLNKQLETKNSEKFFYGIRKLEPIKIKIINEVFSLLEKNLVNFDNIIITGSFIENGFNFNDVDILIVTSDKINLNEIKSQIFEYFGINADFIVIDNKDLINGLMTDPLYQMMLSKCVSKKRIIYKIKNKINPRMLDLHLLKSKTLIDSYDVLSGKEKYYLIRNLIAIKLFLKNIKISNDFVNREIEKEFTKVSNIKDNILDKKDFLIKYKKEYSQVFNEIINLFKNGAK